MSSAPFSEKFNNKNKNFSIKENENFQYNLIKPTRANLRRSNAINLNYNLNNNNYGENMQRLFNFQQQNAIIAKQNAVIANELVENANKLINGTKATGPLNTYKNFKESEIIEGGKKKQRSRSKSKSKKH
jgi:hypothetical protein